MSGTILIVDDVATNRIVLKVKLAAACYHTLQAGDGTTALALARRAQPDLVLLDLVLPDIDGIDVCRRLKADPATRDIPVILMTSAGSAGARNEALRAGADDFLTKPVDDTVLMARLRSLLRARETEAELRLREGTAREIGGFSEPDAVFAHPGTIALIASDRETAAAWRRALSPLMPDRLVVLPRETALAENGTAPDVFLLAADLAQRGDGLRLMSELRSRAATRHAAICIVLPDTGSDTAAIALDLGAADLLPADFDPEETALRLAAQLRRKRQADRLRANVRTGLRLAITDPLTGLYNRHYALPHLGRIARRAAGTGRTYAVMLLDLDRFKAVNDTFGHAAGDLVLAEVAQRLRAGLRPVDLLARIGGEEFLVVLPEAGLATARGCAERLCRAVEAVPVALPDGQGPVPVTISIGLALGGGQGSGDEPAETVMARADAALLAAKSEGRNQVTVGLSAA